MNTHMREPFADPSITLDILPSLSVTVICNADFGDERAVVRLMKVIHNAVPKDYQKRFSVDSPRDLSNKLDRLEMTYARRAMELLPTRKGKGFWLSVPMIGGRPQRYFEERQVFYAVRLARHDTKAVIAQLEAVLPLLAKQYARRHITLPDITIRPRPRVMLREGSYPRWAMMAMGKIGLQVHFSELPSMADVVSGPMPKGRVR